MTTTRDVFRARLRVGTAQEALRMAILGALVDGVPVADIAEAANLSRARIYQIRDENLSDPAPSVGNAP